MAGLLGSSMDDPRTAGILALAGNMVRGDFGGGLLGYQKAYQDTADNGMRRQYMQAQMNNLSSEIDLRKQQLAKQQQMQDMLTSLFGPKAAPPSTPAAPGQLGSGSFGVVPPPAGMPPIPQTAPTGAPLGAGGQSRIGSLTPDELALFKANGLDLTDVYKLSQPDMQVNNGYAYDRRKLQPGFLPGYSVSQSGQAQMTTIGPDGLPRVSAPAGALDTYGAYKRMDAGIAAANDLVQVQAPDGSMRFVPKSTVLQGQPAPSPSMPTPRPSGGASVTPADADRYAILTQELAKAQAAGNTGDVAALQREIARLPPSVRASTSQNVAVMPFQASPTTNQKLSAEAGGKINESWLKSSYEPTVASEQPSQDMIDTVRVTRQAMQNLGSTGWGTQAKAAAGAVLSGLGVAPKSIQMFTANSEIFQKTAMERLWSTLNQAKGPQTEGDAERASKTYANLRNRPEANEFILDFAEAKAQRDLMKARFYQQALPIAKASGDLQEVDREWSKRVPSIFAMPSMRRWSGGLK